MEKILSTSQLMLLIIPIGIAYAIVKEITKLLSLNLEPSMFFIGLDDLISFTVLSFPIVVFIIILTLFIKIPFMMYHYRAKNNNMRMLYILLFVTIVTIILSLFIHYSIIFLGLIIIFLIFENVLTDCHYIKETIFSKSNFYYILFMIVSFGFINGSHQANLIKNQNIKIMVTYKNNIKDINSLTLISNFTKGILVYDKDKPKFIYKSEIKEIIYKKYPTIDSKYFFNFLAIE